MDPTPAVAPEIMEPAPAVMPPTAVDTFELMTLPTTVAASLNPISTDAQQNIGKNIPKVLTLGNVGSESGASGQKSEGKELGLHCEIWCGVVGCENNERELSEWIRLIDSKGRSMRSEGELIENLRDWRDLI
jgi:hypothetical protein